MSGESLLVEIRSFIDQHIGDADLSPAVVAAAHYMSVRTLYRLFAMDGCTVAQWIKGRRLRLCRQDLADSNLAHLSIPAVAARRGFQNAHHFSRLFREVFGMSPRAYRVQVRASSPTAVGVQSKDCAGVPS